MNIITDAVHVYPLDTCDAVCMCVCVCVCVCVYAVCRYVQ